MQIGGVVQVMFVSASVKQGNDKGVLFWREGGILQFVVVHSWYCV